MDPFLRVLAVVLFKIANLSPTLLLGVPKEIGIGSQYGQAGDIYAEQALACSPKKHVDNQMHVCAHRYLPCGTVLIIQTVRTNRTTWCTIMDRGPYGAIIESDGQKRWGLKIKYTDPGRWRGILDMTPAVAADMHHRGFEMIRYWILIGKTHPPKRHLSAI